MQFNPGMRSIPYLYFDPELALVGESLHEEAIVVLSCAHMTPDL